MHNFTVRKGQDLEKTVSKLAVVDRLSVNTNSKSKFIRTSFLSKGLPLPESRNISFDANT
jgi:hypothetical protein